MTAADILATIREANQRLQELLIRLEQHNEDLNGNALEEIAATLSVVANATQSLRALRSGETIDSKELVEYHNILLTFQRSLPVLQARLFLEHARLDGERRQSLSAAAWTDANKATL